MLRKIIAIVLIVSFSFVFTGCGSNKNIEGVNYSTYGLLNSDDMKNPNIEYRVIWGNVIWGVILIETIIAPIYFFGFSLFEPVGKKPQIKGQVIK